MKVFTFNGFLSQYVCRLSGLETKNLNRLTQEACNNVRLIEPLVLYAIFANKADMMLKASRKTNLSEVHINILENYSKEQIRQLLKEQSEELPEEYLKVWRSYLVVRNATQRDNHVKELMREKILYLQKQYGISGYKICKDLKINSGNFYAWMKHGNSKKVSYETARKVLQYLEGLEKIEK